MPIPLEPSFPFNTIPGGGGGYPHPIRELEWVPTTLRIQAAHRFPPPVKQTGDLHRRGPEVLHCQGGRDSRAVKKMSRVMSFRLAEWAGVGWMSSRVYLV